MKDMWIMLVSFINEYSKMIKQELYSIIYEGCGMPSDEAVHLSFYTTYDKALEDLRHMNDVLSIPDNQEYDLFKSSSLITEIVSGGNSELGDDDISKESCYFSAKRNGGHGYVNGLSIIKVEFE